MTSLKPHDRYERNSEVVYRKVNGEFILLPARYGQERRHFYFFEEVGVRIWELLDGTRECHEIIRTVASEFGVSEREVGEEMLDFFEELAKADLIRRRP